MVKSGLVDNPHVSHFRLAAHLSLAFIIFILIFREFLAIQFQTLTRVSSSKLSTLSLTVFGLIGAQIIYGAFTAGLNAGHYYNTYPKMGPDWLPASAFMYEGGIIQNILNNPIMIQWIHRWFAIVVLIGVALIWRQCKNNQNMYLQYSGLLLVATVGFQFILGIVTLINQSMASGSFSTSIRSTDIAISHHPSSLFFIEHRKLSGAQLISHPTTISAAVVLLLPFL